MGCCQAKWKREVVADHKFDFVDPVDYHSTAFFTRIRYLWVYIIVIKSVAVYCANIYTAVTMLLSDKWTNSIYDKCGDKCVVKIGFDVGKWIFVGCIIFSFLLLAYEATKARKVIASRDISYAFTNPMANGYYSLRTYDIFCLFCQIENSTKKMDDFAFFIFFTFKGWKHLLLADAPRQVINALTLYSFGRANDFQTDDLTKYYDNSFITAALLVSMIFTVVVFAGSMILLIAAAALYVPLLCYIQGNLKEYVCHKIDKRITELLSRRRKRRVADEIAREKRIASGREKPSASGAQQPTLPNVLLDDDDVSIKRPYGYGGASNVGQGSMMDADEKDSGWTPPLPPNASEYSGYGAPPMPLYTNAAPSYASTGYGGSNEEAFGSRVGLVPGGGQGQGQGGIKHSASFSSERSMESVGLGIGRVSPDEEMYMREPQGAYVHPGLPHHNSAFSNRDVSPYASQPQQRDYFPPQQPSRNIRPGDPFVR